MGAGNLPMWASLIESSLDWSTPVWEITGETKSAARVKWLYRLWTYKRERQRAQKFKNRNK